MTPGTAAVALPLTPDRQAYDAALAARLAALLVAAWRRDHPKDDRRDSASPDGREVCSTRG